MNKKKLKEMANKLGYKVSADAQNLGYIDLKFIRETLKETYAMGLEDASIEIRNIYQSRGYAPGDWPTPEQCADLIEKKAKEIRGEE